MKKIRKKRCIVCNESFTPFNSTLQKTCSVTCAITYSKLKEAKKVSELNNMRNEKIKLNSLSELIKQTQTLVNSYIRLRDKGKKCIACGEEWNNRHQASHVFDKKQYNRIRFDVMNLHNCCVGCNIYKNGNYENYRSNLPKRIGDEEYQKLENRAKIALRVPHTWTRYELKEIQKEVRILTNKLKSKL